MADATLKKLHDKDGQPMSREYRTFAHLDVDRPNDCEFGFWPQTLRRWVGEGCPKDIVEEIQSEIGDGCFHQKFDQLIGTDHGEGREQTFGLPIHNQMNPKFEPEVLESDDKTEVRRDANGVVARWWKGGGSDASIPEYLEFPVTDRESWRKVKERFRVDDPERTLDPARIDRARDAAASGSAIQMFTRGFYGQLRNWVGVENLSYLFYDDPDLVEEMAHHWTDIILRSIEQLPDDVPVHSMGWWEDMCFNHGPLCSVEQFETFFVPCYQRVMDALAEHGCRVSWVDSDGNIHPIAHGWLKAGVNVMFPCEVAAGTDMFKLREQFGPSVRLKGGIDKIAIARGRDAIDRELDRIAPLLEQGGFVPHLDHLVPPDIAFDDYMYYREQKKKLIGKA
mgnify:CR=1 FL=1